jgi:hypothetical protein
MRNFAIEFNNDKYTMTYFLAQPIILVNLDK